jgi:CO/xanthine dehydrogenase Mo-binding subunit
MASTPVLPKLVGERVKRREDPRLIQGRGTYVDDIKVAGMQHLAFKRSDVAHGRIPLDRHERRRSDGRRRGGVHRRADREAVEGGKGLSRV